MSRAELLALAERVEAATGADRELDTAVAMADGYRDIYGDGSLWDRGNDGYWVLDTDNANQLLPRFTASLDAAMSLVPSGWRIAMLAETQMDDAAPLGVRLSERNADFGRAKVVNGDADTFALALTAAALRALAERMTDED